MEDVAKLVRALKLLESQLRDSGKTETAQYFASFSTKLTSAESSSEIQGIAQQITTIWAIIQYAGFSYEEELSLELCYNEATALVSVNQV